MYSLLSNCVIRESITCQTRQSCVDCQSRQPCHSRYVLATTLPLYTCWSHSDHVSTVCQSCQSQVCHMFVTCQSGVMHHMLITWSRIVMYNCVNCLSVTVTSMSVTCHVSSVMLVTCQFPVTHWPCIMITCWDHVLIPSRVGHVLIL